MTDTLGVGGGAALCAVPKASLIKTSPSDAIFFANSISFVGFFLVEPRVLKNEDLAGFKVFRLTADLTADDIRSHYYLTADKFSQSVPLPV